MDTITKYAPEPQPYRTTLEEALHRFDCRLTAALIPYPLYLAQLNAGKHKAKPRKIKVKAA